MVCPFKVDNSYHFLINKTVNLVILVRSVDPYGVGIWDGGECEFYKPQTQIFFVFSKGSFIKEKQKGWYTAKQDNIESILRRN